MGRPTAWGQARCAIARTRRHKKWVCFRVFQFSRHFSTSDFADGRLHRGSTERMSGRGRAMCCMDLRDNRQHCAPVLPSFYAKRELRRVKLYAEATFERSALKAVFRSWAWVVLSYRARGGDYGGVGGDCVVARCVGHVYLPHGMQFSTGREAAEPIRSWRTHCLRGWAAAGQVVDHVHDI